MHINLDLIRLKLASFMKNFEPMEVLKKGTS